MIIGVGLPMKSIEPEDLVAFAQRVEAGPFGSMALGDRMTYDCYDPLVTLTHLAAVTTRLRFMTSVIALPLYKEGVVAKQAATMDRLSKGRFSLGVGLGGRAADYAVSPAEWRGRAERFEEQLITMKRIWEGRPPYPGTDPVGPTPYTKGGPEVIIGGFAEKALQRAGRLADGIRSFSFAPDADEHVERYRITKEAWDAAGRPGKPRLVAAMNYALGPGAKEAYEAHFAKYYGYDKALVARATGSGAPTTPSAVGDFIKRCQDAGVDELCFTTLTTDQDASVDALADVVAGIM